MSLAIRTVARSSCCLALAVLCATAAVLPAAAQQGPETEAVRTQCTADYRALCSDVKPGSGRILACLRQNADKLSPGCTQALLAARAARQSQAPHS
jgi:hypothetical protein